MKKNSLLFSLLCFSISLNAQLIITVAGNHAPGYSGDGGTATSAQLNNPSGIAVDAAGNFYIADAANNRVRRVSASGIISTIAGNGTPGFSGDGGQATTAQLFTPVAVALDAGGNVYIADRDNRSIRKVNNSGVITTVIGNLNYPNGVAIDVAGNIYVADFGDARVYKVSTSGVKTTFAGNGNYMSGFTADGGLADTTEIGQPTGIAIDATGNVYICDGNTLIRKVNISGIITTVAGYTNSIGGHNGDGGPATAALLGAPGGVAVDAAGNFYITDYFNGIVRKVNTSGIISTIAGNGITSGYSGDWGQATLAELNQPIGIASDAAGDLYIADAGNNVIREVGLCIPSIPSICMVQVDSLSQNNLIYWDKTDYPSADTFFVYRDIANDNYALIGKVPFDSLSMFADTVRSLYAANGDPNASSWRYKIAYHYNCGGTGKMSPMSPYHQSLFMINSGSSFMWTHYQIEGQSQPVSGLQSYLFERDDNGTGNYIAIQTLSASSTLYTDAQYSTYQNTANWRVETVWNIACTPTRQLISTTRSNIRHNIIANGITNNVNGTIQIYPNPANESVTIKLDKQTTPTTIKIINMLGQLMEEEIILPSSSTRTLKQIDVKNYAKGVYTVSIENNSTKRVMKLVVN